jgi:hypothetical protein
MSSTSSSLSFSGMSTIDGRTTQTTRIINSASSSALPANTGTSTLHGDDDDEDENTSPRKKMSKVSQHKFNPPQYTLHFEEPICVYKSKEQLLALCINSVRYLRMLHLHLSSPRC